MWIRAELKERAKSVLRKYYWVAFAVTLVAAIAGATFPYGVSKLGSGTGFRFDAADFRAHAFQPWYWNGYDWNGFNWHGINWNSQEITGVILAILIGASVVSVIALVALAIRYAWRIFVSGPIEAGMDRYFLEARQDRSDFLNLFHSFRNNRYINVVKAIAWRELFLFLWYLLFIIPGWIKGYSYSMIPYLMADNPMMDYRRAMKLSMAMTHGHKWDIFVLDLSFLGWWILGMLCCCVGVFFLNPYVYAARAEMYVTLRQKALDSGLCSRDELNLEAAAQQI